MPSGQKDQQKVVRLGDKKAQKETNTNESHLKSQTAPVFKQHCGIKYALIKSIKLKFHEGTEG